MVEQFKARRSYRAYVEWLRLLDAVQRQVAVFDHHAARDVVVVSESRST
jgi:hypothetical protein